MKIDWDTGKGGLFLFMVAVLIAGGIAIACSTLVNGSSLSANVMSSNIIYRFTNYTCPATISALGTGTTGQFLSLYLGSTSPPSTLWANEVVTVAGLTNDKLTETMTVPPMWYVQPIYTTSPTSFNIFTTTPCGVPYISAQPDYTLYSMNLTQGQSGEIDAQVGNEMQESIFMVGGANTKNLALNIGTPADCIQQDMNMGGSGLSTAETDVYNCTGQTGLNRFNITNCPGNCTMNLFVFSSGLVSSISDGQDGSNPPNCESISPTSTGGQQLFLAVTAWAGTYGPMTFSPGSAPDGITSGKDAAITYSQNATKQCVMGDSGITLQSDTLGIYTLTLPPSSVLNNNLNAFANVINSTIVKINTTAAINNVSLNFSKANPYWAGGNVPITITNSQNTPTTANMPQMVFFNVSTTKYRPFVTGNLGNIRFYAGSQELYSWCESGCRASSHNSVFWVRLPFTIAANGGSNTINMTFLPYVSGNVPNYDGMWAGEAPQSTCTLSVSTSLCNYAAYDNGNSIFTFYDNFVGNVFNPAKWNDYGASISINNGLNLQGNLNVPHFVTVGNYPAPDIIEYYGTTNSSSTGLFFDVKPVNIAGNNYWVQMTNVDQIWQYDILGDYNLYGTWTPGTSGQGLHVFSLYDSALNNPLIFQKDYITTNTFIGYNSAFTTGHYGPALSGGAYNPFWLWTRVRIMPPNAIMPGFIIGNVMPANVVGGGGGSSNSVSLVLVSSPPSPQQPPYTAYAIGIVGIGGGIAIGIALRGRRNSTK